MKPRARTRVVVALLAAAFGIMSGVVESQSRETLETKVIASGTEIVHTHETSQECRGETFSIANLPQL